MINSFVKIHQGLNTVYYGLLVWVVSIVTPLFAGLAMGAAGINPIHVASVATYIAYGIFGGIIVSNILILGGKYICMTNAADIPNATANARRSLIIQIASFMVGLIASGFDSLVFPLILKSGLFPPLALMVGKAALGTMLSVAQITLFVVSVTSFILFARNVSDAIGDSVLATKAIALRGRVVNVVVLGLVYFGLMLATVVMLMAGGPFVVELGLASSLVAICFLIFGLFAFFRYARLILAVAAKIKNLSPDQLVPPAGSDSGSGAVVAKP